LKYFKDLPNRDYVNCTKFCFQLSIIYTELGSENRAYIRLIDGEKFLVSFNQQKLSSIKSKNLEDFEMNKVFLTQEHCIAQAHLEIKQNNYKTAAGHLQKALKVGIRYSYGVRARIFVLFDKIYKGCNIVMPKGLKRIRDQVLNPNYQESKNYIFLLDYSKSMKFGGKIENSVKCILKI